MPGVPRELAEHKLNADPKVRPVKQSLRPFNEERRRAIAEEVQRLLAAGFIHPIKYSKWKHLNLRRNDAHPYRRAGPRRL